MDFKAAYRRFRQWQLAPFDYEARRQAQTSHRCNNCGSDFVGNYCPVCSQKEDVGPITWKSVVQSIGEVWGLHNRSMLYTLVQLFLRPIISQVPPLLVCSIMTSILRATRCCLSTTPLSG